MMQIFALSLRIAMGILDLALNADPCQMAIWQQRSEAQYRLGHF